MQNFNSRIVEYFFFRTKIDDLKELQKLRSKQNGVSVAALALGKKIEKADEITDVSM